jgi:chromosome segregation ATPase
MSVIQGGAFEASAGQGQLEILPTPDIAEPVALTPRNYQTALSLLECAAKALEILYDRRDHLEATIEDLSMRAEGAVVSAQAKVLDGQKLAAALRNEIQDLERRLVLMQQRAELAESQLEAERDRAEAAECQAADVLNLSQGLHSKIMSSFGRGSSAHKALLVAMDDASGA